MLFHPTPFPRGWFLVAWSKDLTPGDVKAVRYFGLDLVLFRTKAGKAGLAKAHCPHQGAHLGHGGVIEGGCIVCPFHGWRYDGATGECVKIPFADAPQSPARLDMLPVQEQGGMILAWYHEQGEGPSWDFPEYPSPGKGWTRPSYTEWTIRSHVYEITENDVDCAHVPALHDFTERIPTTTIEEDGPLLYVTLNTEVSLATFGGKGYIEAPARTTKVGLGMLLVEQIIDRGRFTIDFRTAGTFTPIDEDHVHIRVRHSVRKGKLPLFSWFVHRNYHKTFAATVEQDIPIWENKVYRERPMLSAVDGPIHRYRRWSRQFYPGEIGLEGESGGEVSSG